MGSGLSSYANFSNPGATKVSRGPLAWQQAREDRSRRGRQSAAPPCARGRTRDDRVELPVVPWRRCNLSPPESNVAAIYRFPPWRCSSRSAPHSARAANEKGLTLPEFPTLKRGGDFARGRGRIQRQVTRAFAMLGRSPLSTSELLGWTHSHLPLLGAKVRRQHRTDVRRACPRHATAKSRLLMQLHGSSDMSLCHSDPDQALAVLVRTFPNVPVASANLATLSPLADSTIRSRSCSPEVR